MCDRYIFEGFYFCVYVHIYVTTYQWLALQ